MATLNQAQIATRVLKRLALVGTGQSVHPTMQSEMEELVGSVHPHLRKRGLAPYPITAVPAAFQFMLIDYLAYKVASRFGKVGDRAAYGEALKAMHDEVAATPSGEPVIVDYK